MANVDAARGFRPVRMLDGSPYTGNLRTFAIAVGNGTATYKGDPVKLAGTGEISTIDGGVYQDVVQAATGDVIVGVVVSVLPNTRDSLTYRAASTLRLVVCECGPNVLYEIQEGSSGTAFTANDIGLNCNFVVAAGSTVTGYSGVQLDNSTEATTNTLDVQLVDFVNTPDNAIGSSARWLVRINRNQWANQVAGI